MAKLAQFLTNPGPQHQHAIDRVICYLYTTRFRAIEYGKSSGMEFIEFASNASYGDNPDRRSCWLYMTGVRRTGRLEGFEATHGSPLLPLKQSYLVCQTQRALSNGGSGSSPGSNLAPIVQYRFDVQQADG